MLITGIEQSILAQAKTQRHQAAVTSLQPGPVLYPQLTAFPSLTLMSSAIAPDPTWSEGCTAAFMFGSYLATEDPTKGVTGYPKVTPDIMM